MKEQQIFFKKYLYKFDRDSKDQSHKMKENIKVRYKI